MNDIVARLRDLDHMLTPRRRREAAAEIEHLREDAEHSIGVHSRMLQENERLRANATAVEEFLGLDPQCGNANHSGILQRLKEWAGDRLEAWSRADRRGAELEQANAAMDNLARKLTEAEATRAAAEADAKETSDE